MKINVKGLAFVGFAAAILSANAMAAAGDEKIVTSKAYVDSTFQPIGSYEVTTNKETSKETLTTNKSSTTNYPSNKAITDYVDDKVSGGISSNAQGKSTANYQVGDSTGTWKTLEFDSYASIGAGTDSATQAKISINATTDGTLANAGTGGTDAGKLVTAGAVKTYADSKVAAAITDGDTTHAPSGEAVHEALALKQNANTAVKYAGSAVGSATTPVYVDASGNVTASTYTIETSVPANAVFTDTTYGVMGGTDGTAAGASGLVPAQAMTDAGKFLKADGTWATPTDTTYTADSTTITLSNGQFSATTGGVASNNSGLVTGATVYNYLNGQAFPTLPTGDNACSDTNPCALVMGSSGQPQWIRMAQ